MVVDEQGNEYEATYPKRAKGLVKKGRARFISENMICLACPPDKLGDNDMQNIDNNLESTKPSLQYILEQIDKIVSQTDYLLQTIEKIGQTTGGGCTDEEVYRLKVEALGNIVTCRETTNQQILKFYEKVYDDLKEREPVKNEISRFEEMSEFLKTLNKDDFSEDV